MDGELVSELINKYYNQLTATDKKLLKMYAKTLKDVKSQLILHSDKILNLESVDLFKGDRLTNVEKQIELLIYDMFKDMSNEVETVLIDKAMAFDKEFVGLLGETYNNSTAFTTLNKGVIKELVKENWLGMDFYERFTHKAYNLTYDCKNILRTGLIQGKSIANMIKEMEIKTGKYYKECETLVRSESMNTLNSAMVRQYENLGVTSVEHYTALDERVCKVCGKAHGKKYRIGKQPHLPLHPLCRCVFLESEGSLEKAIEDLNKKPVERNSHGVNKEDVSEFIPRKSRSDFENREEYSLYREKKKEQKKEYDEYIKRKLIEDKERPRKYLDKTKAEKELKGLGIKAVNLEGVDPLFYDDIIESIKLNRKLYPNAEIPFIGSEINISDEYIKKHLFNDNVKYFMKENNISYDEALEYTKSVMSMDFYVDDALIEATHGMTFNSKYFSRYDYVMEMEYSNYLDGERAFGNGNFMTTITHEYGHRVAKLTNQSELVNKVMNKFPNQYVSEYATENSGEYFSEMYAEYVLNPNPTEYVKYFGELLNKALGGK